MRYQIKPAQWGVGNFNYDIMDGDGKLLCQLKAEFDITVASQAPTIVKKQSARLLHSTFTIQGPSRSYHLEGDWQKGNYTILKEEQVVAQVSLEATGLLGLQDSYSVDITERVDTPALLCVVMVMGEQGYQFLAS